MTSNEEMAEKLAEKFYGLIEGDVSVSGGELAKLFVTALDQAGLALSEKAKAYISFEPVLPNGKTLADMFASSDRKPLGTVIDDEDDEEEDDGPDDAGELDELEHMRDVADMAYAALSDLAGHCAQSLSKGMRVIATGRLSQRSYQAQDGTNRTVVEMTVDEIGPSLRYATAQVTKQGGHDGCQGGSTYGNPAGNPPVGPRPAAAPSQPPASDPWANGGSGYTTDTSTTDTGDPEF